MNGQVVPATRERFDQFHSRPLPKTVKALMVMDGEKMLGYTGFYPLDGTLILFGAVSPDVRPEVRKYGRAFVTAIHRTMDEAKSLGMPIYAIADPEIDGSDKLLTHYGFKRHLKEVFTWHG